MNLAQASDVVAALGRSLTSPELERVSSLIEEASDLISAWCRPDGSDLFTHEDDIPDAVSRVTARAVARVIAGGDAALNLAAQTTVVGPFQRQNTFNSDATSGGPWLTRTDKIRLKPWTRRFVWSLETH